MANLLSAKAACAALSSVLVAVGLTIAPVGASAHCDTMDGPVVEAGQRALDAGELDYALVWVKPEAEPELRAVFEKAVAVRKLGGTARELADTHFFETLVRLHRAGEGAPYTGLRPKGTDLGAAIPAADAAIQSGSMRDVSKLIANATSAGLRQRFDRVRAARKYDRHDVAAGRRYVEAYVLFIHYVERTYESATAPVDGHYHETEAADLGGRRRPARDGHLKTDH